MRYIYVVFIKQYVVCVCVLCAGFTELCQGDQIKLIKQGSFEVVLARYTALFDDDGMFIPSMEMQIPRYVGWTASCSPSLPAISVDGKQRARYLMQLKMYRL